MPEQHLHRYRRKKPKSANAEIVFFCTKPECFHRVEKEVLVGKKAECPFCGSEFLLDHDALRRAIPRCKLCVRGKKYAVLHRVQAAIDAAQASKLAELEDFINGSDDSSAT